MARSTITDQHTTCRRCGKSYRGVNPHVDNSDDIDRLDKVTYITEGVPVCALMCCKWLKPCRVCNGEIRQRDEIDYIPIGSAQQRHEPVHLRCVRVRRLYHKGKQVR